jgi:hypothetical protein
MEQRSKVAAANLGVDLGLLTNKKKNA